jgi:hypothetical protein
LRQEETDMKRPFLVSALLVIAFLVMPLQWKAQGAKGNGNASGFITEDRDLNRVPLKLYYSDARGDNFTTATAQGEADAKGAGYRYVRVEGYLFATQQPGTVPLKLYYSDARRDNYTTATASGERAAQGAGYRYVRVEGYLYPTQQSGTLALKNYYSDRRGDNFTTATAQGESDASGAGYRFALVEGYLFASSGSGNGGGGGGVGTPASWSTTATPQRGQNGRRFTFSCPANGTFGSVWGTNVYTDDSSICTAAVHSGLITQAAGGTVTIEIRPGQASYTGSPRYGVTTANWGAWAGSYVFVGGPAGGVGGGGICDDPRTLAIMDEWLARAIPLENQRQGYYLRYEAWGRLVGRTPSNSITVNGSPDTRMSRCEWLWYYSAGLRSTNLGTLSVYVQRRR